MLPKGLILLGLLLNIAGVWFLFRWSPPVAPLERGGGVQLVITPNDAEELKAKREERWNFHDRFSKWGLGLIFVGFVLQFIGVLFTP